MDENDMKAELSSILEVNALDYRLPPSLSVATARQMKSYRAANIRYQFGEQINITLSSGAAYIDPKNSYISFDCVIPADGTAIPYANLNLPTHGGWTQLIQKYTIMHSSGVELDRMADCAGEYQQIKHFYEHDARWRKVVGASWYQEDEGKNLHLDTDNVLIGSTALSTGAHYPFQATDTELLKAASSTGPSRDTYRITIPLCEVAPIFNSNLLLPSFIAAGMRLELTTATKERFFSKIGGWGASAVPFIQNVFINLESFQLTDSITRKLSQISASSGLEWTWTAVHQSATTQKNAEFSFQVSRALSRANNIVCKMRSKTAYESSLADSYTSLPWVSENIANDGTAYIEEVKANDGGIEGFQVQLGAQFIPAAPLDNLQDFYASALKTFGGYRRTDASVGADLDQFAGKVLGKVTANAAKPVYGTCVAIAAVPLESSSTLNESGAAISAQRTAVVNIKVKDTAVERRYDFFVEYSKLATVFLDSVVVRS